MSNLEDWFSRVVAHMICFVNLSRNDFSVYMWNIIMNMYCTSRAKITFTGSSVINKYISISLCEAAGINLIYNAYFRELHCLPI